MARLSNTATIAVPAGTTDPVPGNNTATDTDAAGPQADLAISKASNPNPYVPGALLTYTIVVSNAGPSEREQRAGAGCVAGAAGGLHLDLHAERRGGWRAARPAGSGNIDALVTLAGGQRTSTLHGERDGAGGHDRGADQHGDGDAAAGRDRSGAGQQRRDRQQPGGAAGGSDHQQGEQSEPVRAGRAADLHASW